MPAPRPNMKGYLAVRNRSDPQQVWKTRWLQLHGSSLCIFRTDKDAQVENPQPLEWFDLKKENVFVKFGADLMFAIAKGEVIYDMQARDPNEHEAWRQQLTHHSNKSAAPPRPNGTIAAKQPVAPSQGTVHKHVDPTRASNTYDEMIKLFTNEADGSFRMNIDHFEILGELGKGSYGKVLRVRKRGDASKTDYALKIMSKDAISKPQDVMSERAVLQVVSYQFVVKLHDAFQTPSKLFLVLQYLPGGDLKKLLRDKKFIFPRNHALFYATGVMLALQHLHSINILYRDLKPENIVLDDLGYPVVTDLGLARELKNNLAHTVCGTPLYIAPEIAQVAAKGGQNPGYTRAIDWWSFGVILYEMLLGFTPFAATTAPAVLRLVIERNPKYPTDGSLDGDAISILQALLIKDPAKRLQDPEAIKQHRFFSASKIDFALYSKRVYKSPNPPQKETSPPAIDEQKLGQLYAENRDDPSKACTKWGTGAFKHFTFHPDRQLHPPHGSPPPQASPQRMAHAPHATSTSTMQTRAPSASTAR
eukprot:TRINITY_DN3536_c0_g1_i1.p1 TRINITY_DN3536_c0_g1~~TRINITY_DN3536_c0_g1_i1.p1  ORF type:complete len:533 (+),score=192.93 TRINITY_DN3536_c0_g1_i1:86-1684(+)